eukprot:SAG31_NODE_571_length_13998_cov_4.346212_2_plen_2050_part_00
MTRISCTLRLVTDPAATYRETRTALWSQAISAAVDIPCYCMTVPILVTVYRAPGLISRLCAICSTPSEIHKRRYVCLEEMLSFATDIPAGIGLLVVLGTVYRAPSALKALCSDIGCVHRRKLILDEAVCVLFDILAMAAFMAILLPSGHRISALLKLLRAESINGRRDQQQQSHGSILRSCGEKQAHALVSLTAAECGLGRAVYVSRVTDGSCSYEAIYGTVVGNTETTVIVQCFEVGKQFECRPSTDLSNDAVAHCALLLAVSEGEYSAAKHKHSRNAKFSKVRSLFEIITGCCIFFIDTLIRSEGAGAIFTTTVVFTPVVSVCAVAVSGLAFCEFVKPHLRFTTAYHRNFRSLLDTQTRAFVFLCVGPALFLAALCEPSHVVSNMGWQYLYTFASFTIMYGLATLVLFDVWIHRLQCQIIKLAILAVTDIPFIAVGTATLCIPGALGVLTWLHATTTAHKVIGIYACAILALRAFFLLNSLGHASSITDRRMLCIVHSTAGVLGDLACGLLLLPLLMTGYRLPSLCRTLSELDGATRAWWHSCVVREFVELVIDIPFVAVGIVVLCSLWRTSCLAKRLLCEHTTSNGRRRACLDELGKLLLDIPCGLSLAIIVWAGYRWPLLLRSKDQDEHDEVRYWTSRKRIFIQMAEMLKDVPVLLVGTATLCIPGALGVLTWLHATTTAHKVIGIYAGAILALRAFFLLNSLGHASSIADRRMLCIVHSTAGVLGDLACGLLLLPLLMTGYRLPSLCRTLSELDGATRAWWHSCVVREFVELVIDIPFVAMGTVSCVCFYRAPRLLTSVFWTLATCRERRRVTASIFVAVVLDMMALPAGMILLATIWRLPHLQKRSNELHRATDTLQSQVNVDLRTHSLVFSEFFALLLEFPYVLLQILCLHRWYVFKQYFGQLDARNSMLRQQTLYAWLDLLSFPFVLLLAMVGYRVPSTWKSITQVAQGRPKFLSYSSVPHQQILYACVRVVGDIPVFVFAVIGSCTLWRSRNILSELQMHQKWTRHFCIALRHAWFTVCDVFVVAALIVSVLSWRRTETLRLIRNAYDNQEYCSVYYTAFNQVLLMLADLFRIFMALSLGILLLWRGPFFFISFWTMSWSQRFEMFAEQLLGLVLDVGCVLGLCFCMLPVWRVWHVYQDVRCHGLHASVQRIVPLTIRQLLTDVLAFIFSVIAPWRMHSMIPYVLKDFRQSDNRMALQASVGRACLDWPAIFLICCGIPFPWRIRWLFKDLLSNVSDDADFFTTVWKHMVVATLLHGKIDRVKDWFVSGVLADIIAICFIFICPWRAYSICKILFRSQHQAFCQDQFRFNINVILGAQISRDRKLLLQAKRGVFDWLGIASATFLILTLWRLPSTLSSIFNIVMAPRATSESRLVAAHRSRVLQVVFVNVRQIPFDCICILQVVFIILTLNQLPSFFVRVVRYYYHTSCLPTMRSLAAQLETLRSQRLKARESMEVSYEPSPLDELPLQVLENIFTQGIGTSTKPGTWTAVELARAAEVSHEWKGFAWNDKFWHTCIARDFPHLDVKCDWLNSNNRILQPMRFEYHALAAAQKQNEIQREKSNPSQLQLDVLGGGLEYIIREEFADSCWALPHLLCFPMKIGGFVLMPFVYPLRSRYGRGAAGQQAVHIFPLSLIKPVQSFRLLVMLRGALDRAIFDARYGYQSFMTAMRKQPGKRPFASKELSPALWNFHVIFLIFILFVLPASILIEVSILIAIMNIAFLSVVSLGAPIWRVLFGSYTQHAANITAGLVLPLFLAFQLLIAVLPILLIPELRSFLPRHTRFAISTTKFNSDTSALLHAVGLWAADEPSIHGDTVSGTDSFGSVATVAESSLAPLAKLLSPVLDDTVSLLLKPFRFTLSVELDCIVLLWKMIYLPSARLIYVLTACVGPVTVYVFWVAAMANAARLTYDVLSIGQYNVSYIYMIGPRIALCCFRHLSKLLRKLLGTLTWLLRISYTMFEDILNVSHRTVAQTSGAVHFIGQLLLIPISLCWLAAPVIAAALIGIRLSGQVHTTMLVVAIPPSLFLVVRAKGIIDCAWRN